VPLFLNSVLAIYAKFSALEFWCLAFGKLCSTEAMRKRCLWWLMGRKIMPQKHPKITKINGQSKTEII